MGTAKAEGKSWGVRAKDWAETQEIAVVDLYRAVLDTVVNGQRPRLLDVGCGAGMFCQMAVGRGARVTGLDATPEFIAIARERTPQGDFRAGEMEELPYGDKTFDVVTGFNSFQYAGDPVNALREAGRVAQSGAPVVIAVWGKAEDCDFAGYADALFSFFPPPPPGAPGPWALSQEGALEAMATEAGLKPTRVEDVDCPFIIPDETTSWRALLSPGPAVLAIQTAGEPAVREAVAKAIAPFRKANGGYEFKNKFRYLVAAA